MGLNLSMADIRPKKDVSLALHTVFKIGGVARYFYEARSPEELIASADWALHYKLRFFVLGAGSNTLAHENGFFGLVVKPIYDDVRALGNSIHVGVGAMMPRVASYARTEGLTGFEWAVGIPGTIGGSIRGNAGCFGKSMADVIDSVLAYNAIFKRIKKLSHNDCAFAYRDSKFKYRPELIILSAVLGLRAETEGIIVATMLEHSAHRVATQAIGSKCAGCVFKNVPWDSLSFAGRQKLLRRFPSLERFKNQTHIPTAFIIDELGLKGYSIGGAAISEKHANFFINNDGASSHDLMILISHCKEFVHRKTGLLLEEEIQHLA